MNFLPPYGLNHRVVNFPVELKIDNLLKSGYTSDILFNKV